MLHALALCLAVSHGNTLKVSGQIKVPGGTAGIRPVEK
jgi:hypothetical protein